MFMFVFLHNMDERGMKIMKDNREFFKKRNTEIPNKKNENKGLLNQNDQDFKPNMSKVREIEADALGKDR